MRRTTLLMVALLMLTAFVTWAPAAQAAKPQAATCLINVSDLDTFGGTPLEVPTGSWLHFRDGQIVRTPEIRDQFVAVSEDSLALDGRHLAYRYEYSDVTIEGGIDYGPEEAPYDPPVTWEPGTYPAVWIDYLLPASGRSTLKPGTHTLVVEWYLTAEWSDGWYPPLPTGNSWGGTVTIVVIPADQYPSGLYENVCTPG